MQASIGITIIIIAALFAGGVLLQDSNPSTQLRSGTVTRVIDGDTIELSGKEIVRYLDINTPETVHPDKPEECYGKEAADRNRQLVGGRTVYLDIPEEATDSYGRTLAYVYTDDYFVNGELVWSGHAYAQSYRITGDLYQTLVQLERSARESSRGIWAVCQ